MAQLLTGKDIVAKMSADLTARVEALASQGVTPTLAIVRMGERPDDLSYERTALKREEPVHNEGVFAVVIPAVRILVRKIFA